MKAIFSCIRWKKEYIAFQKNGPEVVFSPDARRLERGSGAAEKKNAGVSFLS
jgi:hypothetical protein